ncbi:hypothetical protein [Rhizobium leguminosarum]|uniref:hypothetical protein n=1 Tax=Rhizobium leguminosarum TaxID=384 RepID=UPI001C968CC6|nr:hypothetical protein [Rhizobium leguminosarum]MBY5657147.1 hypothetical protein [Rhizobium leguminosarum]
MSDDREFNEDEFSASIRVAFEGNDTPATLEMIANIYADISNIRDLVMQSVPLLITLSKTSEDLEKVDAYTEKVYRFQSAYGKGLAKLIRAGRESQNG